MTCKRVEHSLQSICTRSYTPQKSFGYCYTGRESSTVDVGNSKKPSKHCITTGSGKSTRQGMNKMTQQCHQAIQQRDSLLACRIPEPGQAYALYRRSPREATAEGPQASTSKHSFTVSALCRRQPFCGTLELQSPNSQ